MQDQYKRLESITLGGVIQWLLIRGNQSSGRVLLFLHGGPGSPLFPLARQISLATNLENEFMVVYWEQRGTGKSFRPNSSFSLDNLISDTIELSEYLVRRFNKPRIFLLAHSFGTVLGMHAVARRSSLYHAYLAIAQIGDAAQVQTDAYQFALDSARRHDDIQALDLLQRLDPLTTDAHDIIALRTVVKRYHGSRYRSEFSFRDWILALLKTREYTWTERYRILKFSSFSLQMLSDAFARINLIEQIPLVEIPVHFVSGRHDFVVSSASSHFYFSHLQASHGKYWYEFDDSAHYPFLEEPENFNRVITKFADIS